MRLAVIDASPVGGGPVTHALSCAASQMRGAHVTRVRLYDLFSHTCATCTDCVHTGRCTRHHVALDEAIVALADADTLIVGTLSHLHAHDPRGSALLERLVGAFGHLCTTRGLDQRPPGPQLRKRAALVCGSPAVLAPLAMLGLLPIGISAVWKTLDRSSTNVVGYVSVGASWSGPASRDRATACARRLAALLAPPARTRRVPAPVRVTPAPAMVAAQTA